MIVLQPLNMHWINNAKDDPSDLCAHGDVEFRMGADVLLDDSLGWDVTVSAAALYLLRTLSEPHTKQSQDGGQLFPCCGFSMYDVAGQDDVVISGCPNAVDFEVLHEASGAGVFIQSADGRKWQVPWREWRTAVYLFADAVSEFYAASSAKQVPEDDTGFSKFAAEWQRRRGRPLGGVSGPSTTDSGAS